MSSSSLPPALRARLEKRGILGDAASASGSIAVAGEKKAEGTATASTGPKLNPAPLPPNWQEVKDQNTYVGPIGQKRRFACFAHTVQGTQSGFLVCSTEVSCQNAYAGPMREEISLVAHHNEGAQAGFLCALQIELFTSNAMAR